VSFLETPRFPSSLGFNFSGGPMFSTDIVVVGSGFESRNKNWAQALGKWSCNHMPKTRAETDTLIAYFRIAAGRANGFRFKDWTDFQADTTQGIIGSGFGTGLPAYQLQKRYTTGASNYDRPIVKPVTVAPLRNGLPITAGAAAGNYALDSTTGILTLVADASSSASSITAGSTTQVVLAANLGLVAGNTLYLSGFTGADAALVNNLAHTINSIAGVGPYTFTLATNTAGKVITLGTGLGQKYPQVADVLTWSGEFDVKARFDHDEMTLSLVESSPHMYTWGQISIVETRLP
jgi:uncharacterized protein (TIGR02217 family)